MINHDERWRLDISVRNALIDAFPAMTQPRRVAKVAVDAVLDFLAFRVEEVQEQIRYANEHRTEGLNTLREILDRLRLRDDDPERTQRRQDIALVDEAYVPYRCEGCGKTSRLVAHRPGCPVQATWDKENSNDRASGVPNEDR